MGLLSIKFKRGDTKMKTIETVKNEILQFKIKIDGIASLTLEMEEIIGTIMYFNETREKLAKAIQMLEN
jgi:hypothetical protein